MTLTLSAHSLDTWQRCRRRYHLDQDYRVVRWAPKSLFASCARRGIIQLSKGVDPIEAVGWARAQFMQTAANPGLDLPRGVAPYPIAKEYSSLLSTVLLAYARTPVLALAEMPEVRLTTSVGWQPLAYADESGVMHRFLFVDRWDADRLTSEAHSWYVTGDIAMVGTPMHLHVVEVGQVRNGRHASCWARGWKHPEYSHLPMKFTRKDGKTFAGWRPVYLADDANGDPAAWVEQMFKEGAGQATMHTVEISVPAEATCRDIQRQVLTEAVGIQNAGIDHGSLSWQAIPMSRGACDGFVPCPFQSACYAEGPVDIDRLGLYQRRSARNSKQNDSNSIRIPVMV